MTNIIRLLVTLGFFSLIAIIGVIYFVNTQFNQPMFITQSQLINVNAGQTAHAVIRQLSTNRVIEHPLLFKLALKLEPELGKIKKGTYKLSIGMTGRDLFHAMSSGDEAIFTISLVEGLRWQDWKAKLNSTEYLLPLTQNSEGLQQTLGDSVVGGSLEGWLLPDTYHFTANTSAEQIVVRAHRAMQEYLQLAWDRRDIDLPLNTPYEALILASIIEKETGLASERPRIAGVFVNRLRQNMRLQTDPTVIYGMGDAFDGDIRRRDLKTPTAYNTYVIKGLPPTPIAMPGKLAIDAALNPMETDDLYFVARGDGSHYFSTTLKEHNQAVKQYQLKR